MKYRFLWSTLCLMALTLEGCHERQAETAEDTVFEYDVWENDPVPFPIALRDYLTMETEWDTIKDCYAPFELTDFLRGRIRKLVGKGTYYVVYKMYLIDCFAEGFDFDLTTLMAEGYIFTEDDKEALYEYLCLNTSVYNCVATHYSYCVDSF